MNSVVRFISDIQLYQRKKENSRSRSIFFQPCPLGKVRGLKGKCRTSHKQKIPNALYRLNQFLQKRKYEKRKNTDHGRVTSTTENIIKELEREHAKYQQDSNQNENVAVETTTNVVFPDFLNETNSVEEGEEGGETISMTINNQKEILQDTTTTMTNSLEDLDTEGSGSEVVTEQSGIVEAYTVTDQPDEESSTDSFDEKNSLEYQISRSEEFLMNDNEIMENVLETSGDMENLEVNVPFP